MTFEAEQLLVATGRRPSTAGLSLEQAGVMLSERGEIQVDEKRLRQILFNLLGNAIKFTDEGGVRFRVEWGDERLRCLIEDTGRGISGTDLRHIFEPFRQVGDQSFQEGTGLGLPITERLVEMMEGRLEVRSELGKGSLFWFEIPIGEYAEDAGG